MSKITLSILQKIAPQTKTELLVRFIPYLNEALPRYGIINEFQVSAFLSTAAFESQYFQKTKEGKARQTSSIWIKYQSKYWHTNFMGRGIFQTTHQRNYKKFGERMVEKGIITDKNMFVNNPKLLEEPKWAVESACEYWETNNLDIYARKGIKGFFGLQGKVNKGSAEKEAHDYPDRLVVYERARVAIPDDFILGPGEKIIDIEHKVIEEPKIAGNEEESGTEIVHSDEKETLEGKETLTVTSKNEQDVNNTAEIVPPTPYNDIGFIATIKKDLAAIGGGNLSFGGLSEYATQASGWPPWVVSILTKVAILVAILSVAWLIFRVIHFGIDSWKKNKKIDREVLVATDVSRKDFKYVETQKPVKAYSWMKAILPSTKKQPNSVVDMEEIK